MRTLLLNACCFLVVNASSRAVRKDDLGSAGTAADHKLAAALMERIRVLEETNEVLKEENKVLRTGILVGNELPITMGSLRQGCRRWCGPADDLMFAGSWRQTTKAESAPPPCCTAKDSYDDDLQGLEDSFYWDPKCGNSSYEWEDDDEFHYSGENEQNEFRGPRVGFAEHSASSCVCDPTKHYTWDAPESCTLLAWSAKAFCAVLGKRTMLLIGDSTMHQAAVTLINMVLLGNGQCHKQLAFGASDTLINRTFGFLNRGYTWIDWIARKDPDFVVLSAGTHIRRDQDYHDVFDAVLKGTRDLPKQIAPKYAPAVRGRPLHIMWKTQQPGDPDLDPPYPAVTRQAVLRGLPGTYCFNHESPAGKHHARFMDRDIKTVAKINAAAAKSNGSSATLSVIDMRMLYWATHAHTEYDYTHYCLRTEVLSSTFPRILLHEVARRTNLLSKVQTGRYSTFSGAVRPRRAEG